MCKILEFRPPAPKPLTPAQKAAEVLSPKQAVDLIVLNMLFQAMPKWVEREWPFRQLEIMANELRTRMEEGVPENVTREQVRWLIDELRPAWKMLIDEIDPSLFW